ncbi:reverse transcriptase domain-containing protein [Chitinophaga agri]|uniref:RNA-directed DNA polymerase n=1 Tax=Chitinophaga agri TaxID=2703787 RepID=A0A6B9ZFB7_9BACT|nr:reverse transcriptase domain-containing protein [Chitinophaga agri]QHS59845.1 hypothetical protein GWR21_09665 [Chitinophaga agri]
MLLQQLAPEEFLLDKAWRFINKDNLESFGISGETIAIFKANLATKIPSISKQLITKEYKFSPTRAYVIPKDNGKLRPLQIPEVRDRVVLKGIAIILEDILNPLLSFSKDYSFAYQKKMGVKDAVLKMVEYYNQGYTTILEADIKDFFPSVNRMELLNTLFSHLTDDSLNDLITQGISQKIDGLDKIESRHRKLFHNNGIPQGNPLSPLFSNLYLRPFDERMINEGFKLIRYADDFIVMCKDSEEAHKAWNIASEVLEGQLKLELHKLDNNPGSKTRIVKLPDYSFSFLSVAFDGTSIYPSVKSVERFIQRINKLCNLHTESPDVLTLLTRMKNTLDGWISAYSYTEVERRIDQIDNAINEQILNALTRLDWHLKAKTLGKVPLKQRKQKLSGQVISSRQRTNSGVPQCKDILERRREEDIKKKGTQKEPQPIETVTQ